MFVDWRLLHHPIMLHPFMRLSLHCFLLDKWRLGNWQLWWRLNRLVRPLHHHVKRSSWHLRWRLHRLPLSDRLLNEELVLPGDLSLKWHLTSAME